MMSQKATLLAGVAKREITTRDEKSANDPLYAKALVLDDGVKRLAIIAMDTVGIGGPFDLGDDFMDRLRARITDERLIPPDAILVNATHTHTEGPMLCKQDLVLEKTLEAVKEACNALRRVTAGAGAIDDHSAIINRTLRLKDGSHQTIRQAHPCPPDAEMESLGPIDPYIGILRFDTEDEKPYAILYTYSCHPLLGVPGKAVTANYPGFASKTIEEISGAPAIFLQGTLGDVTEILYKDVTQPMDSEPVGRALGLSTLKAARTIQTQNASINVITERIAFPRRTDIPLRIDALKRKQEELLESLGAMSLSFKAFLPLYIRHMMDPDHPADYAYRYMQAQDDRLPDLDTQNKARIQTYLQNLSIMEKLCRIQSDLKTLAYHQKMNLESGEQMVACEVVGIRIGDFVMISSPAEMLVEVGQNIKTASQYPHTYVISPSNGYVHYGAPAAYYDKGGYEVTECMLAPEWQQIYERTALDIISRL